MSRVSMWETVSGIVRRDLLLAMRRRSDAAMSVFFLVIVVSLFPLGVGPEPAVLRTSVRGVVGGCPVGLSVVAWTCLYGRLSGRGPRANGLGSPASGRAGGR